MTSETLDWQRLALETADSPDRLAQALRYPIDFDTNQLMDFPPHAKLWWDLIEEHDNLLIKAARGHMKSRTLLLKMVDWIVKNHNERIIIISKKEKKASELLTEIEKHIEKPDSPIHYLMPENPDTWSKSEMTIDRELSSGDPTLSAAGIMSSITGKRASKIILDDIITLENVSTKHRRDKVKKRFNKEILPMLEPSGKLIVLGTPKHQDDLYSDLESREIFTCFNFPAEYPNKPQDYHDNLYDNPDNVLWYPYWDKQALHNEKYKIGSRSYAEEYLLDLSQVEGGLIHKEWLEFYGGPVGGELDYAIGVDPSIGESEMSDYTAIVVSARQEETGNIYILDMDAGRWESQERMAHIRQMYNAYDQSTVYVEESSMSKDFISMLKRETMLPVKGASHQGKDKVARMNTIIPKIENGDIQFHNRLRSSMLIDQLIEFPEGSYDDLVDALYYACKGHLEGRVTSEVISVSPEETDPKAKVRNLFKR